MQWINNTLLLCGFAVLAIIGTTGQEQERRPDTGEIEYEALRKEGREVIQALEKEWDVKKIRANVEAYSRRPLSPKEQAFIQKAIAFAKNPRKDWVDRETIVIGLGIIGHVSMIEGLKEIAWQASLSHEDPQSVVSAWAVISLSFIADKQVIEILIDLLGHPNMLVRLEALTMLRQLVGESMPEEYRLSKGFNILKLEEESQRRKVVSVLKAWWQREKEKVKMRWRNWVDFSIQ